MVSHIETDREKELNDRIIEVCAESQKDRYEMKEAMKKAANQIAKKQYLKAELILLRYIIEKG